MQIIGSNIWGGPTPLLEVIRRDYGIEEETLEDAYLKLNCLVSERVYSRSRSARSHIEEVPSSDAGSGVE